MARYTGPRARVSRRLGTNIWGTKGENKVMEKRPFPPGQHGRTRRRGDVLRVLHAARRRSRRPASPMAWASASSATSTLEANRREGVTGLNMLQYLELRLDNIVYRAGVGRHSSAGAPAREPRARRGQRQAGSTSPAIGSARVTSCRCAPRRARARWSAGTWTSSTVGCRPGSTSPRRRPSGHGPRPAVARAHRHARPRADDRRALLQVVPSRAARRGGAPNHPNNPGAGPRGSTSKSEEKHMLVIQRPTVEALGEAEGDRQRFAIGPLEPGFGHTLGNSLRRTLLSCIPGPPITQVRFDDALHEFDTIAGVSEDVTDIILNIKDIVIRCHADDPITLRLDVRGPSDVTAASLQKSLRHRNPQRGPAPRIAELQGSPRRRRHDSAWPWLFVG